jgi:outer membrane receptor for ferrienterochelin and colicin
MDRRVSQKLSVGTEVTWRVLDEPVKFQGDYVTEDRDEQLHKLYLYWTPRDQIAVSAELVYDKYDSENGVSSAGGRPDVETYSLPVNLAYFRPSGLFATIGGTYVDQDVDRSDSTSFNPDGSDNFFLVDASVGYRLPKRRGIISLGVTNLFDKEFDYQDDSYREFSQAATTGPYFPERIIQGRVTLNF